MKKCINNHLKMQQQSESSLQGVCITSYYEYCI